MTQFEPEAAVRARQFHPEEPQPAHLAQGRPVEGSLALSLLVERREVLLAEAASDVDQRVLSRTGREVHGSRHLDDHPLVRNFSRNTNFWTLPVAVTGISGRNSTRSGTFQMASLLSPVR